MKNQSFEESLQSMDMLFNPASIAIVGASSDPIKPSGQPLVALINNGYRGKVIPVNPKYKSLLGLDCYPSLEAVPFEIDMVIIAVSAPMVLGTLRQCALKKVKACVIFTSGFSEVGPQGKAMQQEITRIAREGGIRVCGPNCMGIFSARNALMANFAVDKLPENTVIDDFFGFISQSGGFGAAIYEVVRDRGIGFSHFISTGNEADVDFSDYLGYMARDQHTRVIGGYLEGVRDGKKFIRAAEMALEEGKPILLIKTGRSQVAAKAASSHTGSLVGSDKIYQAVFKQKGVLRMESIEELTATLSILVAGKIPRGNRVCILASSGGSGVLLADKCAQYGLDVVSLSGSTRQGLDNILPAFASSANPVDITSQIMTNPLLLKDCIDILVEDPDIDILILCFWALHGDISLYLDELTKISRGTDKLVLTLIWGPEEPARLAAGTLHRNLVPAARDTETAVKALASLASYADKRNKYIQSAAQDKIYMDISPKEAKKEAEKLLQQLPPGARLTEYQSKQLLRAYGIPCTRDALAATPEEAVSAAEIIGFPVVMKIESPDILHKTDAGCVVLNLNSPGEVRQTFDILLERAGIFKPDAQIRGVLVQEMLPRGTEIIIGISRDEVFGPVVVFGMGGVLVEVLKDISMGVPPLAPEDAREMLDAIRGKEMLNGVRGGEPVNREMLVDTLLRVSRMACDLPRLGELDINPLIAYGGQLKAADALIILKD